MNSHKLTDREKYIALVSTQTVHRANAIIWLEGDAFNCAPHVLELYKDKRAQTIVVSGNNRKIEDSTYSVPWDKMRRHLISKGVPSDRIVPESKSEHTQEQAVEVLKMAKDKRWKKLIIVTPPHHQYRAYLTFLKELQKRKLERKIILISSPAPLKWTGRSGRGVRLKVLDDEFKKIKKYRPHVASYEEGIQYLQWKESQRSARKNS